MDRINLRQKAVVILGATATGKSGFAIELAHRVGGEIISCDSMQLYRGLDIGTAKVDKEHRLIPHHMIDILEPDEQYSAQEFAKDCKKKLIEIDQRGNRAILVGGTGFFVKGLLYGHSFAAPKNDEVREELGRLTNEQLMRRLMEVDSQSAAKLHQNDRYRLIRALEIYQVSGKSKSELNQNDDDAPIFDAVLLCLEMPRQRMYAQIDARVDEMFDKGLVDEVRGLLGYRDCQSMRAIGYKELIEFLDGNMSLDAAKEKIKQATRNYAKRQLTFFRGMELLRLDALSDFEQNYQKFVSLL